MKYLKGASFAGILACLFTVVSTFAQTPPPPPAASASQNPLRDPAKEQALYDQLAKKAPKAVEKFKAATAALDADKFADAIVLYREVLALAPDFQPALRRNGYALAYIGQREDGLKMLKRATELDRTTDNLMGYAMTLSCIRGECQPTTNEISEALTYAREAVQKDTEHDSENNFALAEIMMMGDKWEEFDRTAANLIDDFPDQYPAHYYRAISLANRNDLTGAQTEIKKAESLGMPPGQAAMVLTAIEIEKGKAFFGLAAYMPYFYVGLAVVILWSIGLLALFFFGRSLSAKTLHSIETGDPNDITGSHHAGLRQLYRKVISIAGIYWYISQPIVMLIVLVATAGGILVFFWIGTIPIKLVLIIGFIGAGTLFVMIKSLFVRTKMEDPGRALTEEEAPGMWRTVREVAEAVQTRPVTEIRITPGTDLAVYERGKMRAKMNDKADRILILGAAVINDFNQNAFRAVLAHEYGHFSNRDTAGGDIAFRVNNHIFRLAEAMGNAGTATVYNIGFQFLRVYHFLLRRITHGATRLQEVLADRVAVYQYGAAAFQEGLTHVVRREIEFSHLADKEINASYVGKRALQNLYELAVENDTVKGQLDVRFNEAINRATTADDTHPSPADRFKYAARITSLEVRRRVEGSVWELFKDREGLIAEMNAQIEQNLRAAMYS
jgi:tetratricopeptide (TPR) repeat protein